MIAKGLILGNEQYEKLDNSNGIHQYSEEMVIVCSLIITFT